MSRKAQQTRSVTNRNSVAIEQQTIVEDNNLLPQAEELEKLKQIDPSIIHWIMQRAEKEQETRMRFNMENIRLAHRNMGATLTSLWLAFMLAVITLALGALFVWMGKEVAGTIFGGVGLLVIIQSFLKFGRK